MLKEIQSKIDTQNSNNTAIVLGTERSVNLPENSVDKVLMVDVYNGYPKREQ